MCGRYNFTVEDNEEIQRIIEHIDRKYNNSKIKTGEMFPTNVAPILINNQDEIEPAPSIWGFPKFDCKGVIINARSETAHEKKTFRESLVSRRCVIPASGFYEWNSNKEKIYFTMPENKIMYMAGIYNNFGNESKFVILTTNANSSIEDVHDRMPLILYKEQIDDWIYDNSKTSSILRQIPSLLTRASDYEQTTLNLF